MGRQQAPSILSRVTVGHRAGPTGFASEGTRCLSQIEALSEFEP